MNSYDLMLSDEEREFVKKRYPDVDLDDLGMPVMGLQDVTSLNFLDTSLKYDLENGTLTNDSESGEIIEMAINIKKKIAPWKGFERRKRHIFDVASETTGNGCDHKTI